MVGFSCVFAQTALPYNNEWIDFTKTYHKIKVSKAGLHRISFTALDNAGVPTTNAAAFKMYCKGQEIPLFTSANTQMGVSDYIEFYAEKNDGSLDSRLYLYPDWQPNPHNSLFTDTLAYFLTIDNSALNLRYVDAPNNLTGAPPKELYFMHEAVRQNVNTFYAGKPVRIAGINNNFSDFEDGEGFVGSAIEVGNNINYNVATRSVYTGATAPADTVVFRAKVLGQSNLFEMITDHRVQMRVNTNLVIDYEFEGYSTHNLSFTVPASQLSLPNTVVNVASLTTLQNGTALGVNRNSVPLITATYPHSFDFGGLPSYKFTLKNDAPKYIEITNFNGGVAPVLYDLTNRLRFLPETETVSGSTVYKFHLPQVIAGGATRTLFFSSTATTAPAPITTVTQLLPVNFTNYNLPENQGNYLIISHPQLMQGEVNQVERYKQHRSSAVGGSYTVVVANIEELYDQFAWGISKHPLSINNFIRYAIATWSQQPQHLLLLGKSVVYRDAYPPSNPANFARNLVPSFGHSASDNMLSSAFPTVSYRNQLATGRVPAKTPAEIGYYLDKIIEYENLQFNPSCHPHDREWMKYAMHIAGGYSLSEADLFFNNLETYRNKFEDINFGGKVVKTYQSFSANAVDPVDVGNYINNGLSVINFVGHGSGGFWAVDIGPATSYQNYGKYPFIMASSCFVGDIHSYDIPSGATQPTLAMSEEYVLAQNLGSIGFLATVSSGFPIFLHQFMTRLYDHYCKVNYGSPIGVSLKQTIQDVFTASPNEVGTKLTCQEFTLVGDPAVVIKSWKKPEYVVDANSLSFSPAVVTADVDTFTLKITVTNLGMAVADSFTLRVNRKLPDGSAIDYTKRFASVKYKEELSFNIPTGDPASVEGENAFTVFIDDLNQIPEDCEDNNTTARNLFIFSELLVPIFPCNYAVVNNPTPTLRASTGQPILPAQNYILQLDTSRLFIAPLEQTTINSKAGVIEWQPNLTLTPNTVYYWRTAPLKENPDSINWKHSSFLFHPDLPEGWNQSHYYQLSDCLTNRLTLDPVSRLFTFNRQDNHLTAANQYNNFGAADAMLNGIPLEPTSYCIQNSPCQGGIAMMVFKPDAPLQPLYSQRVSGAGCEGRGQFGNVHCSADDRPVFEFYTADAAQIDALVNMLQNQVPAGYYILMYSLQQHRLSSFSPSQQAALQTLFANMGITNLFEVGANEAFIAFGKKDSPDYSHAQLVYGAAAAPATISIDKIINEAATSGSITSPPIGPATQWSQVSYQFSNVSASDSLAIYGVKPGLPDALLQTLPVIGTSGNVSLNPIGASAYPFIKLQLLTNHNNAENATPTQIDHWRTTFTRAPEVALNYQNYFSFYNDTLQEGETFELQFAITNAEANPTDSLVIAYAIINANNQTTPITQPALPPIAPGQTVIATLNHSTQGFAGHNILAMELNSNQAQPEKFRFNNVVFLPFFVNTDKINPYINVTIDGRHVTNGELVSAKPEIIIKVTDENRHLALNDTSNFELYLVYPSANGLPANMQQIYFNQTAVQFTPATPQNAAAGKNSATIVFSPTLLTDGTYELRVRAKDRSGNNFAPAAYSLKFKVINTPMISNLLNYPNPFTSSTRFVFTLTGAEVPQFMNIQIMTVSGRVVREISAAELGPLHIGNNITQFAWDGTDQFGNPLANGLYLYRFVSRLNGQTLEHYSSGADNYIKNGIGKMYLMR